MLDQTQYHNGTYTAIGIPYVNTRYDEDTGKLTLEDSHNPDFTLTLSRNQIAGLFKLTCDAHGPIRSATGEHPVLDQQFTSTVSVDYARELGLYRISKTAVAGDNTEMYLWAGVLIRVFEWLNNTDFDDETLNDYFHKYAQPTGFKRDSLPVVAETTADDSKDHICIDGLSACNVPNAHPEPDPENLTSIETMPSSDYAAFFNANTTCSRCRKRIQDETIIVADIPQPMAQP